MTALYGKYTEGIMQAILIDSEQTSHKFWNLGSDVHHPICERADSSKICNHIPISTLTTIPQLIESYACEYLPPLLQGQFLSKQFGYTVDPSTGLDVLLFADFLSQSLKRKYRVYFSYTNSSETSDSANL